MSIEGGSRSFEGGSRGTEGNTEAGSNTHGSRSMEHEVYSILHTIAILDHANAHELLLLSCRLFKNLADAYVWFFSKNDFLQSTPSEILQTPRWDDVLTALEEDLANGYFGEQNG